MTYHISKDIKAINRYSFECQHRNLTVGDRVRVTRIQGKMDHKWGNEWLEQMNDSVGKEFTILYDHGYQGYELNDVDAESGYDYPVYVLEKV